MFEFEDFTQLWLLWIGVAGDKFTCLYHLWFTWIEGNKWQVPFPSIILAHLDWWLQVTSLLAFHHLYSFGLVVIGDKCTCLPSSLSQSWSQSGFPWFPKANTSLPDNVCIFKSRAWISGTCYSLVDMVSISCQFHMLLKTTMVSICITMVRSG